MDDGWIMALTKLYHNKNKKVSKCTDQKRISNRSKFNNSSMSSSSNPPEEEAVPKRSLIDTTSCSIPSDNLSFQKSEIDAVDLDHESAMPENPPGIYIIRMKSKTNAPVSEEHSIANINILLPNQVDCP